MKDQDREAFGAFLTATHEIYGARLTPDALSIWWGMLSGFPMEQVRNAMAAHMADPERGRFAPKPADVINAIVALDGRPGPEEAWSMIPKDEDSSVVWTEEMAQAFGTVTGLIDMGDLVAARMAFTERYRSLVKTARSKGEPVKWTPSLGNNKSGRELALLDAAEKGRITASHAKQLLPYHREDEGLNARLLSIAQDAVKRIEA